jgi:hypothetical protein
MFSLCPVHNVARNVTVSLAINEALKESRKLPDIVKVVIIKPDEGMKKECIFIDRGLLVSQGLNQVDGIVFCDRDKASKKMNDRITINKLFHHLSSVCPECLKENLGLEVNA